VSTQITPSLKVVRRELVGSEDLQARCQCRLHTHRSVDNQPRKRPFSSSGSSLMGTDLTKGLLQIVVGPWQIRHLIAEKEMGAIALRHFEKMCQSLRPRPSQMGSMLLHMQQDHLKTELPFLDRPVMRVIKQLSELMKPSIHTTQRFPIRFRVL
jgi:hypothetical protein